MTIKPLSSPLDSARQQLGSSTKTTSARQVPPSPGRLFVRRILKSRTNVVCLIFLGLLGVVAIAAPWIAPYDPAYQKLASAFLPLFSDDHILGTDQLGRDTFSRLIYATQISLVAPLIAVGFAAVTGLPLGLLAGYLGGKFDWITGRIADALIALPALVLALAIIAIFGPGLVNAMLAVGAASAPRLFRVVRGSTINVREETYIEASKVVGCSTPRTVLMHVLPNVRSPLLVQVTLMLSLSLLAEAGLSFLGLGVQPPTASWGSMLRSAFDNRFQSPWMVVPPGLAIMLTILSLNMLGDGIRDAVGQERRKS
ncbi:ABC transporter permease [Rhodococcoides kyotonense]|uniref:Peptide/nickel transport system permease protein n=1 Tax=Rhodococcoides kyotonense TaxID=398843 RepID=A0A239F7N2_9NOCA|nr:ABC transporter permease [Rhodococcus kyotonensis]SNS52303.1 peptide/nickel transport system permease protein [Rhodococcus kyotonensis]